MTTANDMRREIVKEAHGLINTPYAHQHRTRRAVDCIGFLIVVGVSANVLDWNENLPAWQEFKNYDFYPDPKLMHRGLKTFLHPLPGKTFSIGDVIWLRDHGQPIHLGIVVGDRSYIHSLRSAGKVIESILTPHVKTFIKATFRFPLLQESLNG